MVWPIFGGMTTALSLLHCLNHRNRDRYRIFALRSQQKKYFIKDKKARKTLNR